MFYKFCFMTLFAVLRLSLQDCPEEYCQNGIKVKWSQTSTAYNVESDPPCYDSDNIAVRRNCTDDTWTPSLNDVEPCIKVLKTFNITTCPPGYEKIAESNKEYCYHISSNSSWDYPCFNSGGASVVTDFNERDLNSLIDSLIATNISRYYWLPAHRMKMFNPVVWSVPGPNWGLQVVANDYLLYQNVIWKNCLALDVESRVLKTDSCLQSYPSLCIYINNNHYPALCPKGYHAFRYKLDNGTCFGIERSKTGMTFEDFRQSKCRDPMSDNEFSSINRFIFMKISEIDMLPSNEWCWFKRSNQDADMDEHNFSISDGFEGVINSIGTIGFKNASLPLSCMACETEVVYGETEFMFEYNEIDNKLYLTIYYPSGLWKYDLDDKGIQCFSDAKGFVRVVSINDLPFLSIRHEKEGGVTYVEKIVYMIDLVAQTSAQYWCEGHTFNLSLISTNKLIVNPKGKEIHVFAMTIKFHSFNLEIHDASDIEILISFVTEKFGAEKVLWMDIYDFTVDFITILLHIHISVATEFEDEASNIQYTYNIIQDQAILFLPEMNCSFVNLSSSLYCLPKTTVDNIVLDWELTSIGHISAPKQFCLQSNGLPVKRQCLGSYHNGGVWGVVEGMCDSNYTPSKTTEFLYNVVKAQVPSNYTTHFLTDGLEFVLGDINIIIPADIYYLSMSLQHILNTAHQNDTCVDLGDIDNIAWVMDRVMELDYGYLRLAQTLNSTNVILNSVNDITEMIAKQFLLDAHSSNSCLLNGNDTHIRIFSKEKTLFPVEDAYQLAVTPQYVTQISYPMFNNVTGIALINTNDSENFTDMELRPLYGNTTLEEVMSIENIEIATWVPWTILKNLKPNTNDSIDEEIQKEHVHVIISIYNNDVVFQELVLSDHVINSRIIGVSIPGFLSNLENPLPIIFKELNKLRSKKFCGFWDFNIQKSTMLSGLWKTQGCFPVKSQRNITVCECYHLTHFSQLITAPSNSDKSEVLNEKQHYMALNIITLIGCFLSIMGIIGIWITAAVFANWRRKAGTKILLQLSTAIALPLIFIVIFNLDNTIFIYESGSYTVADHMKPLCIALGSLLHYSILASFMWMLITAILQFIRYVRVLGVSRPSRFMFKFSLIGWGIPIIPVVVVLSLDVENYVPELSYCKRLCYPKGIWFILSVLLPICIILCINVVLFLLVIHSISRGTNNNAKTTDIDLIGAQLRLSIFLFFLLGLTWIFGIFSFSSNLMWSYLFCLTSTLQGFVLFIYFIVCDPATRNMWITLVKPPFNSSTFNSSRNSISSLGTQ